jgi:hypothetical protein
VLERTPSEQRKALVTLINSVEPGGAADRGPERAKLLKTIIDYRMPAVTAWVLRYDSDTAICNLLPTVEDIPAVVSVMLSRASPNGGIPGGEYSIGYVGTLNSLAQHVQSILGTNEDFQVRGKLPLRVDVREWVTDVLDSALKRTVWSAEERSMLSKLAEELGESSKPDLPEVHADTTGRAESRSAVPVAPLHSVSMKPVVGSVDNMAPDAPEKAAFGQPFAIWVGIGLGLAGIIALFFVWNRRIR